MDDERPLTEIVSMTPAQPGWYAGFDDGDHQPIACWVVERDYWNEDGVSFDDNVVGYVVEGGSERLSSASTLHGFKGYFYQYIKK